MPTTLRSTDILFNDSTTQSSSGLGFGQTWQNVTASRAFGTTYTNTTGRPIAVQVQCSGAANNNIAITVGGVALVNSGSGGGAIVYDAAVGIVPPSATYSASGAAGLTLWVELR